jgi:hypothetical protein
MLTMPLLRAQLYGVAPWDALSLAGVCALLLTTAVLSEGRALVMFHPQMVRRMCASNPAPSDSDPDRRRGRRGGSPTRQWR